MAESQRDETQPLQGSSADAGTRLRQAREGKGLSRADIAATTKIPERHIAALEAGNYAALAGRSYALGFSRTYARAVGLDEHDIMREVRQELGAGDAAVEHRNAFEPGDPSRVPSKRIAWLAALIAFGVTLGVLFLWRGQQEPVTDPAPLDLASEGMAGEALASEAADLGLSPADAASAPVATEGAAIPAAGAGLAPPAVAPSRRRPNAERAAEPARLGGILPPEPGEAEAPGEAPPPPSAAAPSTVSE